MSGDGVDGGGGGVAGGEAAGAGPPRQELAGSYRYSLTQQANPLRSCVKCTIVDTNICYKELKICRSL